MSAPVPRKVFLTGGSRGIGAAIAEEFASRGYHLTMPSRAELDLGDAASVENYLRAYRTGSIDILINNAGINVLAPLETIEPQHWQAMVQTNLNSALRLIQAFGPDMVSQGWGRILNVSTVFSVVTKEHRGAYSMTKAALNALTRSAAVEFGPGGVIVNALAPGYVDTALTRQNNTVEAIRTIESAIPLRRLAQASELAKAAAFLCSEENTYLTGQIILVDGGFTCL